MGSRRLEAETTAEAYLELLKDRGIDVFLGNAGTDFASLVEAFARFETQSGRAPRPLVVPHEFVAVSMAHGYYAAGGRPAAVMVHVNVGTGNASTAIITAARANVPILMSAGRTPITEEGLPGARDLHIHWAQESFDQAAMLREYVKWDYELRMGAQLETVVDRALAVATSEPAGPVYLTLPREVLAERLQEIEYFDPPRLRADAERVPDPAVIEEAARALIAARNPIVIAKSGGRDPRAVAPLVTLAETLGLPVFEWHHSHVNFPQDHPLHAGYDPTPHLGDVDVVVVVESDAPWFPKLKAPRPEAKIIQIGQDPLFSRYPIRGFAVDLGLGGAPRLTLAALAEAARRIGVDAHAGAERRARWEAEHRRLRQAWSAAGRKAQDDRPLDMLGLSRAIGERLDASTLVVNEYDLDPTQTCFRAPGTYFGAPASSGLGWGLGAALGAKLAASEKTVICTVGDGSYIFGAPLAAHWVRAHNLPVHFVIFNNRAWNAVKRS